MAKEKTTRQSSFRSMKARQVVDPATEQKAKKAAEPEEITEKPAASASDASNEDPTGKNNLVESSANNKDAGMKVSDNSHPGDVAPPETPQAPPPEFTREAAAIQGEIATGKRAEAMPQSTIQTPTTSNTSNTFFQEMVASPQPPSEGKAIRLNAGIHIEANRKNIRSHRGSYSLSDKAYQNLVRLAEITNNSYNEIFNRLLEDIEFEDIITE